MEEEEEEEAEDAGKAKRGGGERDANERSERVGPQTGGCWCCFSLFHQENSEFSAPIAFVHV